MKQLVLWLCLFVHISAWAEQSYTEIENRARLNLLAPTFSERKVEKIRLSNGLEAYLISDPKTDKSGAVMSVKVGSWDDPKEYPGLAHFLEHMLFLGTKHYPEESGYQRFMAEHGGLTNAFTTNVDTNYIFTVDNTAFEEGLDRFSSFFKEPLFNPSGVARELLAIDQEYSKNLDSDDWRMNHVDKALANPEHPFHSFSIGNIQTLGNVSRETFQKWYRDHYSANLMRLVVVSPLPLDKLRTLIVEDFKGIPSQSRQSFSLDKKALDVSAEGKLVYIEPIKDTRTLALVWELPFEVEQMRDSQPASVICHVIGHEGEESLLAQLKRENLAEKLSCGQLHLGDKNREFIIEITLTDEGVKEIDHILSRAFQTITLLKEKGIPQSLFDEIQQMNRINYQYQQREDLFGYLMKNANWIQDEDLSTYPEQTLIVQKYDPEAIRTVLNALTPQQGHYFVTAPSRLTGIPFDKHEPWLNTAYAVRPVNPNLLEKWSQVQPHPEIDLPPPNPFIPRKLELFSQQASKSEANRRIPLPELLLNNEKAKVYYSGDAQFLVPKSLIIFDIKTPQVEFGNALKVVLADLYVKALQESLNAMSYPAKIAGLEYDIARKDFSIEIEVTGYSDNVDLLFDEIMKSLRTVSPTQQEFDLYKKTLQRDYQNFAKNPPVEQAIELFKSAIYKRYTTDQQKAQAIETVTFDKFSTYLRQLFQQTFVEGTIYGNVSKKVAENITQRLLDAVSSTPYPKSKQKFPQVILLPNNEGPFYWESTTKVQGNAAVLTIEGLPEFSFKMRAAQQLLMQAVKEPFFSSLRTQQQTGYLVFSDALEVKKQLFNLFAIQSITHDPRDLLARFEQFIEGYMQEIDTDLPEERFETIKNALIFDLEQPRKSVSEMGEFLHKLAFEYEGDFDWVEKRIQGFKELTYAEFLEMAHQLLGKDNKRRIAVLLRGLTPKEKSFSYAPLRSLNAIRRRSDYTRPNN